MSIRDIGDGQLRRGNALRDIITIIEGSLEHSVPWTIHFNSRTEPVGQMGT